MLKGLFRKLCGPLMNVGMSMSFLEAFVKGRLDCATFRRNKVYRTFSGRFINVYFFYFLFIYLFFAKVSK